MVKKKRQSDIAENGGDSTESCDENQGKDCPHITRAVDIQKVRKYVQQQGLSKVCNECQRMPPGSEPLKEDYEYDITLWLCLKCGSQGCGRLRNEHALKHFKTPRSDTHCITINTETLQIWCYTCDTDLNMTSAKRLIECVDYIKKMSTNSPNVETIFKNTLNNVVPLFNETVSSSVSTGSIAKNNANLFKTELKVKGLTNLGMTCFFNAVLQCLAQTPFLLDVLREMAEPGELFTLPGGKITLNGKVEILEPISGVLKSWGPITQTLHDTLLELSNGTGGTVVTPNRLLSQLTNKFPQFGGGDQHDSHELLRHLLEAVRSEDLRRYQAVILKQLELTRISDIDSIDSDLKQRVKFYGNQATERIMRPEQVFRGFLVSTLTCQDCMHTSIRHEYFLDISLPISTDKPQPPRRRMSPEPMDTNAIGGKNDKVDNRPISKHQLKKERRNARKGRKYSHKALPGTTSPNNDSTITEETNHLLDSSSEQSDADVEDNIDEPHKSPLASISAPNLSNQIHNDANGNCNINNTESGYNSEKLVNSDSIRASPEVNQENQLTNGLNGTHSTEMEHGDSSKLNSDFDSGVASPDNNKDINNTIHSNNNVTDDSRQGNEPIGDGQVLKNEVVALGLSIQGSATFLGNRQNPNTPRCSSESNSEDESALTKVVNKLENFALDDENHIKDQSQLGAYGVTKSEKQESNKLMKEKCAKEIMKQDGWTTTMGARYNCDDTECSIQSCLNQFTALELMTGNNKVCCDACTERINGKDGKNINTNATKQFLISNPPAVLILHLKRFQVGPRFMFRKLTKTVSFPFVLDIAPFCGAKVKDLPNVSNVQKKLVYSLYGVVEHSGGMRGGHYVAYVKSRTPVSKSDPRWAFLPKGHKAELDEEDQSKLVSSTKGLERTEQRAHIQKPDSTTDKDDDSSLSGYESEDVPSQSENYENNVPVGKWYYISDNHVREVSEEKVLSTQAYLLFYERIL